MANGDDFIPDSDRTQRSVEPFENILQRGREFQTPGMGVEQVSRGLSEGFTDVYTLGATKVARDAGTAIANFITSQDSGDFTPEDFYPQDSILGTDPTSKFIGGSVPVVASIGALGKGIVKSVAGRGIAKARLPGASGKLSESLQKVFKGAKEKGLGAKKDEVLKVLEDGLASAKDKSGTQGLTFKRWIKIIKNEGDNISAETLSEMESAFGGAAKFSQRANNPILQKKAKDINRFASQKVDQIAKDVKVPEFISRSAKKSKLLKEAKAPTNILGMLIRRAALIGTGAAIGGAGFQLGKSVSGSD